MGDLNPYTKELGSVDGSRDLQEHLDLFERSYSVLGNLSSKGELFSVEEGGLSVVTVVLFRGNRRWRRPRTRKVEDPRLFWGLVG